MSASVIESWDDAVARSDAASDPRDDYRILIPSAYEDRALDLRSPDDRRPEGEVPGNTTGLGSSPGRQFGPLVGAEALQKSIVGERVHGTGIERPAEEVANARDK